MSLLMTESFDNGNSSPHISFGGGTSVNTTGGVYNTGCLYVANNTNWYGAYFRKTFRSQNDNTSNTSINFSFWFKAAGPPTLNYSGSNPARIIFVESLLNNLYGFGLGIRTDGQLSTFPLANHPSDFRSDDGVINVCDNQWHFIEFNGVSAASGSTGYSYAYVDSKLACATVGTTSYAGTPTRFDTLTFLNLMGNGCRYWIDDLTIWDQIGSTYVSYKGPVRIQTLRPSADISSVNAVSTGASNWQVLDEDNQINSSDYITISNTGNVVVEMSNLMSGTTNVYGYVHFADISAYPGYSSNVRITSKYDISSGYQYAHQLYYTADINQIYRTVENNFITNSPLTSANLNDLIITVEKIPS